jgi:hypothetical protein
LRYLTHEQNNATITLQARIQFMATLACGIFAGTVVYISIPPNILKKCRTGRSKSLSVRDLLIVRCKEHPKPPVLFK